MNLKVLHQNGHCNNWNRESLEKGIGNGCIISPVHEKCDNVRKYKKIIRENSIFDPQFYLPSSQKKNFHDYDFFPNTIMSDSGFMTQDYGAVALESAKRCVNFQLSCNFKGIIIPTRFFEQMDPNYITKQSELFVKPFLSAIKSLNKEGKKVYLTVPLTSHMLDSEDYRRNLLNWITSYPEIDGIYIICQYERGTKQIQNSVFLINYMKVISAINNADLDVIVGYSNTESLLYSVCGDITVTMGAFENTRIFSLDKFVVSDEIQRGPKPRLYIPKLLNWIHLEHAKVLKNQFTDIWNSIYTATEHSEQALSATKEPAFNSPPLYKHYFEVFSSQIDDLALLTNDKRYQHLYSIIDQAIYFHEHINKNAISLDQHGNGEHLQSWKTALEAFSRAK